MRMENEWRDQAAPMARRCWKHSRQKTGRPWVGRNGTVVSLPHAEQLVLVSTRSRPIPPAPVGRAARLALQPLQRLGSFLKFLSAKNNCSPAVQMKGAPQSTQMRLLSWNSITPSFPRPCYPATLAGCRGPGHRLGPGSTCRTRHPAVLLVRLATLLLARSLARERLFGAAAIAGLQVEGVLLDILDDIFLLHLPFEATKRAFDGLAILYFHFSQARLHPPCGH